MAEPSPRGEDDADLQQVDKSISDVSANDGQIKSGPLAGRSLMAAILIVGLPVLFQNLMAACVGLVDKMLVGGLDADTVVPAMDGLGIGSYVGWLMGIAMSGLGIGGQAIIARAIGRGDVREGEYALAQAMVLSVVWGILVGAIVWMLAPMLATVCGLSGEAGTYCTNYVRVVILSLPLIGVMMVGAMCMAGSGETLRPALIAVAVNIVNIVCSWWLSGAVFRLGDLHIESALQYDMNVMGIAAGTAIGYLAGGVLTILVLVRGVKDLRLRVALLGPLRSMIARIIKIGIPNFFEGISMWGANILVLMMIGWVALKDGGAGGDSAIALGEAGIGPDHMGTESMLVTEVTGGIAADVPAVAEGLAGAHIIAVQWESFSFLPGFAIGTAAAALAGQYLGAGNTHMARRAVWICTGLGVVLMGLVGVVYAIWGRGLTAIVSDEPLFLEIVPQLLLICGVTQVFFAISMVVRQALRGVGDTTWTFLITTGSSYGIRLPAAWYFGVVLDMGLPGIWIGLCGELSLRALFFLARFMYGGWATKAI